MFTSSLSFLIVVAVLVFFSRSVTDNYRMKVSKSALLNKLTKSTKKNVDKHKPVKQSLDKVNEVTPEPIKPELYNKLINIFDESITVINSDMPSFTTTDNLQTDYKFNLFQSSQKVRIKVDPASLVVSDPREFELNDDLLKVRFKSINIDDLKNPSKTYIWENRKMDITVKKINPVALNMNGDKRKRWSKKKRLVYHKRIRLMV